MMIQKVEHEPSRPSWDCLTCGRPWPCDPAREHLTLVHHGPTLAIMATDRLLQATQDMPTASPNELFERFLAWTRSPLFT